MLYYVRMKHGIKCHGYDSTRWYVVVVIVYLNLTIHRYRLHVITTYIPQESVQYIGAGYTCTCWTQFAHMMYLITMSMWAGA